MGTVAAAVAGVALVAGCSGGPAGITSGSRLAQIVAGSTLERFEACDDLLEHVHEEAARAAGPWGLSGGWGWGVGGGFLAEDASGASRAVAATGAAAMPMAGGDGDDSTAGAEGAGGGPAFSGTNVHEEGVDEPDLVKTDGRRLLTVAGGSLRLVDLTGDVPRLAGTLDLPDDLWDHRLFLAGDRALVIGQSQAPAAPRHAVETGLAASPGSQSTAVLVVDVADVDAPAEVATVHLEGWFLDARLVDGVARLVLQSWPAGDALPLVHPTDDSPAELERAADRNAEVVRSTTVADWLPSYAVSQQGQLGPVVNRGQLVSCDQVHHPVEFSGISSVSVVSVDPADPTPRDAVSVLGGGETVYATADNLYVTTTAWPEPPAGGDLLTIEPAPTGEARTDIHAFDITDPVRATYQASGSVPGHLLNQFSMSEHDGHLRVATTEGQMFMGPGSGGESSSTVTVLARRESALVPVGQVGGLGRGERIYAVRFIGPLGYVVTFRETDPLYVIDLADPAAPRVRGELKILGYSAYLHPVGDGLLLGVGQDATEEGRRLGTQVSLFDVRDPAAPTRLHQLALGPGQAEAEYDHHAFLWWEATGTAVLPVQQWLDDPQQAGPPFYGAVSLGVDDEGIRENGRLSHVGRPGGPVLGGPDDWDWAAAVRRSVVVGDMLLTLSEKGVLASDLLTLDDRAWLPY